MMPKTPWIVFTILFFGLHSVVAIPPKKVKDVSKYYYETDGHYWTVLVVAAMLKVPHSKEIAYHAEYPDNVINSDGYLTHHRITFMYPKAQKKVHALTGGDPKKELEISIQMFKNSATPNEIGTAAHRLGDSYSHINDRTGRMYPHIIAHLFQWKWPDKIKKNSARYLDYVKQLVKSLGGEGATIDMTVFNYIVNAKLTSEENSAILKAEYNYIISSPAFCVEKNEIAIVQKYLTERLSSTDMAYTTYKSTNQKGQITTVIIFSNPSLYANRFPE